MLKYTRGDMSTVMDLGVTGNLTVRINAPYAGLNYILYPDRFYTFVDLCEHLLLRCGTLMTGTAMTNRRNFPKKLVVRQMN